MQGGGFEAGQSGEEVTCARSADLPTPAGPVRKRALLPADDASTCCKHVGPQQKKSAGGGKVGDERPSQRRTEGLQVADAGSRGEQVASKLALQAGMWPENHREAACGAAGGRNSRLAQFAQHGLSTKEARS